MNYLIYSMYALMFLFLGALAVGCGDSRGIAIGTQCLDQHCRPTREQAYQACLSRNPNYYGSPAWRYWVDQCRIKWDMQGQGYPSYSPQPSTNDR